MEEQLDDYCRAIMESSVRETTDLPEYIETVNEYDGFAVLLSVSGNAVGAYTDAQMDELASLGLTGFSDLTEDGSYLAVIEDGEVVVEMFDNDPIYDEETEELSSLTYEGHFSDGTKYILQSAGANSANFSSCLIDGKEYSKDEEGVNVVLYDTESGEIINKTVFDTVSSSVRNKSDLSAAYDDLVENGTDFSSWSGRYQQLYLYNLRCDDTYKVKSYYLQTEEIDLTSYLETFYGDENYLITFSSQGDISALSDTYGRELEAYGLYSFSDLNPDSAWVAVVDGEEVLYDISASGGEKAETSLLTILSVSGGSSSSVKIDSTEYSPKEDSLNIVIYNTATEQVVDTITFSSDGFLSDKYNNLMEPENLAVGETVAD